LNRSKLLIENIFVYGIIQSINKIIPFLMLPIITRLLPTPEDFGKFDIFYVISNFGTSIAKLGIYDAIFREFFDNNNANYQKQITSTGLNIVLISSCIISIVFLFLNNFIAGVFIGSREYFFIVNLSAIAIVLQANQSILSTPTRMQNQRIRFLYSGLLGSLSYYSLGILFLKQGLAYNALIYANIISGALVLLLFIFYNHSFFKVGTINLKIAKNLLQTGLPLAPVFVLYWLFQSSSRLFISNMLSLDQLGIYAVGVRLSSISSFIQMAFAEGWLYFTFSTMKDEDQAEVKSKLFNYMTLVFLLFYFLSIIFAKPIFKILLSDNYVQGYIVFPFLFLSPLMLILYQTVANQFIIAKKSYYSTICVFIGGIFNIGLNFIFVQKFGIKGAAFATLLTYVILVISALFFANRIRVFSVPRKYYFYFIFIILFSSFQLFYEIQNMYLPLLLICVLIIITRKDLSSLLGLIRKVILSYKRIRCKKV